VSGGGVDLYVAAPCAMCVPLHRLVVCCSRLFLFDSLRQQQGFVNNDKLVRDFERRKRNITALEEQLAELKDRFLFLTAQTQGRKRDSTASAGGGRK
jgi:hypothetical protein